MRDGTGGRGGGLTRTTTPRAITLRMEMEPAEYLKLAELEDRMWYFRSMHRHFRRELLRAGVRPDASMIDTGCGTGGTLLRLRKFFPRARLTGIDLMPLACELARQRCGADVDIRQGDATAMP